jgi:hypothetical protein
MHIMGAACELIEHLAAAEANPLSEDSPVLVLARAGALALMSKIELDGERLSASLVGEYQLDDHRCQRESGTEHEKRPDSRQAQITGELDSIFAALFSE